MSLAKYVNNYTACINIFAQFSGSQAILNNLSGTHIAPTY